MPKLPAELTKEVASASRDLTIPVYGGDSLKAGDGAILYSNEPRFYQTCDLIASDCHAYSVLQKRSLAVIGKEYEVKPASSSRADKKAADLVKAQLTAMASRGLDEENGEAVIQAVSGFDQVCNGLLDAILKGYAPGEIMWDTDGSEIVASEVRLREQRRFTFAPSPLGYKPRLLTSANLYQGEPLPPRKFLFHTFAPSYGPRGRGLATRLFWPVFFKRQGIRFWLLFSDKYGSPTAIGKYPKNASAKQKQDLLDTLDAIATEAGIIIPEDMDVKLLEAMRSSSTSTYEGLANYMDKEASKCVLGETLSTDIGNTGSRAASETHNSVRQELVKADADLLSDTLNRTLVRWISNFNLPDANPPTVWRITEQPEDLNARVNRDKTLFDQGFRMKQEKVVEVYGEGYQDTQTAPDQSSDNDFLAASGATNKQEEPDLGFTETQSGSPDVSTIQLEIDRVYASYTEIINMSVDEVLEFAQSNSKGFGNSAIRSTLELLRSKPHDWTELQVKSANKAIAFINSMKQVNSENCALALKAWGYDPGK